MCILVVPSCRKCLPHVCFGQSDKTPLFLGSLVSGDMDASTRAIDAPRSSDFRAHRPFRRRYIYGVGPAVADVDALYYPSRHEALTLRQSFLVTDATSMKLTRFGCTS